MIDQAAIQARVAELLAAEGRPGAILSGPELDAYVDAAARDLIAEHTMPGLANPPASSLPEFDP